MAVSDAVLDRVRALRPSWASLTDADLSEASTLALRLVSSGYYGEAYNDALVWAIAHIQLLDDEAASGGSTPGPFSSVSTGQRSVSFGAYAGAGSDPWWSLTAYGRNLIALRDTRIEALPFSVL